MNVLFVCNGNIARSQEAEIFFNSLQQNNVWKATSSGVDVKLGKPIDPLVLEVMDEIGYDLSHAKRQFVDESMIKAANKIISFIPMNKLPEFIRSHKNVTYWPIADPRQQSIEFHRYIRDEIKSRVEELVVGLDS